MPRVSASGWSASLTHPTSGRVIRPDVVAPNDVQYIPGPNTLPRIRLPVRRAPEWLESEFDDNPAMSVHLDGNELPIDELVDVELPEGRTLLVGEGGKELRQRVSAEYDAEERPTAASNLVSANTTYSVVDNTGAAPTETIGVQSASGESELAANITLADTDPFVFTGGGIKPAQTCFTTEGEAETNQTGAITFSETSYSSGLALGFDETNQTADDKGGGANDESDYIEWEFTTNYAIPESAVDVNVRDDVTGADGCVAFSWYLDGNQIDTLGAGISLTESWTDVGDGRYNGSGWTYGDLAAGTHTLRVEFDGSNAADQDYRVDVVAPYDSRYTYNFDNTVNTTDGYLDGPEYHPPSLDAVFNAYQSAFSIVGGSATATLSDISGAQALALSNDFGSTYPISASNSTSVSGTFPSTGAALQLKATLSRYEPSGVRNATPRTGYDAQRLDAYNLDATIESQSLLIDQEVDNSLDRVLSQVLGEQFSWTYSIESGTPTITIDEPGNTVATRDPEISAQQIDKRLKTYKTVTIKGSTLPVSAESFQASASFVNLTEDNIVTGSEAVYDASGTQYTRGVDFEMDYSAGQIKALSGGGLSIGTDYQIDYRHQIEASHTVTGATGDELIRTISGVVSDRQAEQIAFVLAEVYPNVSEPRYEGNIVVPRVDATFDPLEALQLEDSDLPSAATPIAIRGEPELTPLGLALRLGTAPRLESALSGISEQVGALSDRV